MQVKPLNPLPLSACQVLDGGRLFGMVLELLEGGSLAERISASPDGRIREFEVVQLGFDLLAALGFIHSKGVIHRDIKVRKVPSCL